MANLITPANPQIVFSITAPYYPLICPTKCTFIAADGAVNYYSGDTIDPDGLNLDGPQAQVAVACTAANAAEVLCVTATSLTDDTETQSCTAADALAEFPTPKTDVGSSEASTTASASSSSTVATPPTGGSSVASTANSFVPPYPTVTVSATVGSSTRSGVSTGIQATSTGGTGGGNGTFVPFTGAAHRVSAPIEGSLLALMGLVFAL